MLLLAIFHSPSKGPLVSCTKNNPYIKWRLSQLKLLKLAKSPLLKLVRITQKTFKFENKNGSIYSLIINCKGDNESFFRRLNSVLANQPCKILKDHTVTPENFKLLKENKYGCSVFAKIYLRKSGKTRCRISRGSHKNLIEIDELVDENFRGSCILKIYQAYIGSSKSISLSVEEILVREVDRKESYFTDESNEESEDSDKE